MSSVSNDEFHYNAFRGGRRDKNYSFKDQNDLSRYHGSTNFVAHRNEGTREYRVWIPEDLKVIETSKVRFQKPQQSNSGAVLASPDVKFSDYVVVYNGEDHEDETINNIPAFLPQNSDSETECEELSETGSCV
ncbi:hypothetical protein TNCT_608411 [Trichonephila clavata]|uniref:Uncharacterized protein n=1 Tax=Trichonephila clavata TaxID=2740835 RepID=A0A8X6HNV3_TRICU|nr:hypothetical protein TNCT_608411 [Trichonephila clavata]